MKRNFHFYNYIGFANLVFITLVITTSNYLSGGINFRELPISALGGDPNVGLYFNSGLIIFAVAQTIFALIISHKGEVNQKTNSLFIAGGISLVLAGYYDYSNYPAIHNLFGTLSVVFTALGLVIVSNVLFPKRSISRYISDFSLILVVMSFYLQEYLPGAQWEAVLVLGVIILNIIFSIPLIKHSRE